MSYYSVQHTLCQDVYNRIMLKITLLTIGTIKEPYLQLGIRDYVTRLSPYVNLNIVEIKEYNPVDSNPASIQDSLDKEAELLGKYLDSSAAILLFDIKGEGMTSTQFSRFVEETTLKTSHLIFIIGSSHGVSPSIHQKVHRRISFSSLTFPHQLFRLMVVEQLYRAILIQKGHPYHK
jgi:23S rRNA (pseudouridine1915-N3)-methyltransferase